jgi:phenylalanyl-tRNA synthetase beta chain
VPDDPTWVVGARVREALVAAGLLEAKPLPFVAGSDGTHVRVANPLADDEPHLRTSVLETLARRAEHNLARMHGDVRLFEVGSVFAPAGHGAEQAPAPGLPVERLRVGLLVMGARRPPHFTEKSPPAFDLWDAKALAEVVAAAGFPGGDVAVVPAGDGDSLWRIDVDGVTRGEVRQVPLDLPPWASPAFGVELDLGQIGSAAIAAEGVNAWDRGGSESERRPAGRPVTYRPLPTTPAATFDLALVVADDVTAGEVAEVLRSAAGDVLERLQVFDEFRGGELPLGTRSLAWRVTLRDPQRTFSQKEIEGRKQKLLRALEDSLGVRQRTA